MKTHCDHFLTLKLQKISNFIKKYSLKCTTKQHQSQQYGLCLHCGYTKCFNLKVDDKYHCAQQHAFDNKHPLVIKQKSCQIFCFVCGILIQQLDDDGSKKIQKFNQLFNKVHQILSKSIQNNFVQQQDKKNSNKTNKDKDKDINKKQKIIVNKIQQIKPQKIQQNVSILRVFGLANMGNTCFFNSILQCLYSTLSLHQFYDKHQFKDDFNITFKKFLKNTDKVFCPKNIFSLLSKTYKFLRNMGQQDAFQLYVLLIDLLIQSSAKKENKITQKQKIQNSVGSIFGFICANRIQCLACHKINWNKDFHLGLTIPVIKSKQKNISLPQNKKIDQKQIGIQNLYYPTNTQTNTFLDNYFNLQYLDKSNGYKCQKCSQSQTIKKAYIIKPPQILTINFKLFNNSGNKLDTKIQIPNQVILNSYCLKKGNFVYQLYAGAVHSGSSRGGHYVAYSKRQGKQWYYFSDSHFKQASANGLKEAKPYVIFYRRLHQMDEDTDNQSNQKDIGDVDYKQIQIQDKKYQNQQNFEECQENHQKIQSKIEENQTNLQQYKDQ